MFRLRHSKQNKTSDKAMDANLTKQIQCILKPKEIK